jgi:Helix-turn-helix domain
MNNAQVKLSNKALSLKQAGDRALDERDMLLTRKEAARYLRKSVATLERWSRQGIGPKHSMVGRLAVYSLAHLRAYVAGGAAG